MFSLPINGLVSAALLSVVLVFSVLVSGAILTADPTGKLLSSSDAMLESVNNINPKNEDLKTLDGSWAVASVEADGELTNAQIGQEPGDVITFSSVPKVHMF